MYNHGSTRLALDGNPVHVQVNNFSSTSVDRLSRLRLCLVGKIFGSPLPLPVIHARCDFN